VGGGGGDDFVHHIRRLPMLKSGLFLAVILVSFAIPIVSAQEGQPGINDPIPACTEAEIEELAEIWWTTSDAMFEISDSADTENAHAQLVAYSDLLHRWRTEISRDLPTCALAIRVDYTMELVLEEFVMLHAVGLYSDVVEESGDTEKMQDLTDIVMGMNFPRDLYDLSSFFREVQ
jgi:hypothetical protein